jgi:hypothetical protein
MGEVKDFKTKKAVPQGETEFLPPDTEVVEQVEQILTRAKSGELRSIAFICELYNEKKNEMRLVDGWSDMLNVRDPLAMLGGFMLLFEEFKGFVQELRYQQSEDD